MWRGSFLASIAVSPFAVNVSGSGPPHVTLIPSLAFRFNLCADVPIKAWNTSTARVGMQSVAEWS